MATLLVRLSPPPHPLICRESGLPSAGRDAQSRILHGGQVASQEPLGGTAAHQYATDGVLASVRPDLTGSPTARPTQHLRIAHPEIGTVVVKGEVLAGCRQPGVSGGRPWPRLHGRCPSEAKANSLE